MAMHRGAPPLFYHSIGAEMWPVGFVYDLDVMLPPAHPPNWTLSYADMATNRCRGLCQTTLPLGNALRAGYVSSSNEEEAVPRL